MTLTDILKAFTAVRAFLDKPDQVTRFFESDGQFVWFLIGTANFFRTITERDENFMVSRVDAWKHDCHTATCRFQDIAIGVSSSNVATSTLSLVPIVGLFFAASGAIVGMATKPEIDNRTNHMNDQFKRGTQLTAVFDQVDWITEYLDMVKAMSTFSGGDETEFDKLREGILAMAVVAAKRDGEISREFMYKLINDSGAAVADLPHHPNTIDASTFNDLRDRLAQSNSHSALRLLEPMGAQGYSAAINVSIATAHQVASRLTEFSQRSNKSFSGLGSLAGGLAINVAIEDVVNACKARDEAWERYGQIRWELERIAKDVTASVMELMK